MQHKYMQILYKNLWSFVADFVENLLYSRITCYTVDKCSQELKTS